MLILLAMGAVIGLVVLIFAAIAHAWVSFSERACKDVDDLYD